MQEKELTEIADGIFSDFVNRGMTFREALDVLRRIDRKIRAIRVAKTEKIERTSIKEALQEARKQGDFVITDKENKKEMKEVEV